MGIIETIKNTITRASVEAQRAELSKAEAAHKAASDAWADDETAAKWKVAEDAERHAKQLKARLARAERLEAEAREAKAQAELEQARVELSETLARLKHREGAWLSGKCEEVATHYAKLADIAREMYDEADAHTQDVRAIESLRARLGLPAGDDLPNLGVVQMIRAAQHGNREIADKQSIDLRMRSRIGELIEPVSAGVFHGERLDKLRREAEGGAS